MDYAVLKADDMPAIVVRLIESIDAEGPFGAKGLGESGVIPVAAAVANAVKDAIGGRFTELPITPARVRAALAGRRAAKDGRGWLRAGVRPPEPRGSGAAPNDRTWRPWHPT